MANSIYDIVQSMADGMHAGIYPNILAESAYSRGINLDGRGGLVRTRPGFTSVLALPQGRFQGMFSWSLHSVTRLVVVISGRVYLVDTTTRAMTDVGTQIDAEAQCYGAVVDRFFVIQNGVDPAVVLQDLSGTAGLRVPQDHTIPVGYALAYAHFRIHTVPKTVPDSPTGESGRPYFVSSDPMSALGPASVLQYKNEQIYWNDGGASGPAFEMGFIQGFGTIRNAATGTGYGGLLTFCERGVSAFDVSLDRATWKDEQFVQALYMGPGTLSPWAIVHTNGTVLYRSIDGIRILSYTTTNAQSAGESLSNAPQSLEVGPYLDGDADYLAWVTASVANNRALVTCGGTGDRQFKAVVSIDFANIASAQQTQSKVVYNGIWQIRGRTFQAVVGSYSGGAEQHYALLDGNELVILDPDATTDLGQSIPARLVTRTLLLGKNGFDLKKLNLVEAWFRDIARTTSVTAYYRPSGFPLWGCAGTRVFQVGATSLPQVRRAVPWSLPDTASTADPVSKTYLRIGTGFQFALDFDGHCVLESMRVRADVDSTPPTTCSAEAVVNIVAGDHGQLLGDFL